MRQLVSHRSNETVTGTTASKAGSAAGTMILPLALAQFIASYAATSTNVAISSIAHDLHTTVAGVQTAITLFTLVMAALMIPGSKLTGLTSSSFSRTTAHRRIRPARPAPARFVDRPGQCRTVSHLPESATPVPGDPQAGARPAPPR
jgi:hypothetical protein